MTLEQLRTQVAAIQALAETHPNLKQIKKQALVAEYNRANPSATVTLSQVE